MGSRTLTRLADPDNSEVRRPRVPGAKNIVFMDTNVIDDAVHGGAEGREEEGFLLMSDEDSVEAGPRSEDAGEEICFRKENAENGSSTSGEEDEGDGNRISERIVEEKERNSGSEISESESSRVDSSGSDDEEIEAEEGERDGGGDGDNAVVELCARPIMEEEGWAPVRAPHVKIPKKSSIQNIEFGLVGASVYVLWAFLKTHGSKNVSRNNYTSFCEVLHFAFSELRGHDGMKVLPHLRTLERTV